LAFLLASALAVGVQAAEIKRVAFLPFTPEVSTDAWLGYLLADVCEKALATNTYADVPRSAERRDAVKSLGTSITGAVARDPMSVAKALGLDYVAVGWVSRADDQLALDLELRSVTTGERVLAQSFRAPMDDPLDAGLYAASHVSEAIFGAPLLSYATQVVRPVKVSRHALEPYGLGLAALDRALGAKAEGDGRHCAMYLIEASNRLAEAVTAQPELLWPYDPLLEASQRIIDIDPTVPGAYVNIAVARKALGDIGGAVNVLRNGRSAVAGSGLVRVALANVLLDLAAQSPMDRPQALREAVQAATEGTSLEPALPEAWAVKGAAAFDSGDYEAAATAYLKAADLRPLDPVSELGAGLSLARLGRWEEARGHLEQVTQLDRGAYGQRAARELEKMG
jgi:tetratricopeptide (TPR) repeat protein